MTFPSVSPSTLHDDLPPLPPPHRLPSTFSTHTDSPSCSGSPSLPLAGLSSLKTLDRTMPPPSFVPRKRKLAPALSSPSPSASPTPDAEDADDDDYAPVIPVAGPSKRSTKGTSSAGPSASAGSSSRAGGGGKTLSREQLRKANHSMIERRRREKINSALGELRDMVPGLGGETKGGEFKLEVLEQTVMYMKQLKERIDELEQAAGSSSKTGTSSITTATESKRISIKASRTTTRRETTETTDGFTSPDIPLTKAKLPAIPPFPTTKSKASTTPPSPSLSPDPNETEPETNLPPAYTLSTRPISQTPSITSLLQSANSDYRHPISRPQPGPQATNPTLYLPFPTPSPTSPFLTYHNTSSSSSGSSGPPEPSPFIAPLQGMALFGGALNLDPPSDGNKKDLKAEEAANLLLAFSSPDTLHPVNGLGMGMGIGGMGGMGGGTGLTPKMVPVLGGAGVKRERRGTLESEEFDFVLDGGVREQLGKATGSGQGGPGRNGVIGKTARDILKM